MKTAHLKVSIVIPVYNAENYLRHCYDSLASQTYGDIELVFVNDGSTDSSLDILKQFAREDARVRIIEQDNRGTLLARKNGVAATTGDWCMFVDPDDWLEADACARLVAVAENDSADIISFGAFVEHGPGTEGSEIASLERWLNRAPAFVDGLTIADAVFVDDACPFNVWSKFIRGNVCRGAFAGQRDVHATFAEDLYEFFSVAKSATHGMRIIGDRFYHYTFGEGIATRNTMTTVCFMKTLNAVDLANELEDRFRDGAARQCKRCMLLGLYNIIRTKIEAGQRATCLKALQERSSRADVVDAVLSYYGKGRFSDVHRLEKLALLFSGVTISVVVPVYNVEKYLRECLDSIVSQSDLSLEIICVNDGSTDGSRQILEEYPQIRIVDQANAGPGAARNAGLDVATGKYVYFIDSDDKSVPGALACLTALAETERLDQIVFSAEAFASDPMVSSREVEMERRYHVVHPALCQGVLSGPAFLKKALPLDFPVTQQLRFFRREFLVENQLRYPSGIIHEDNVFSWKSAFLSKRICALEQKFFLRRVRNGSIMRSSDNFSKRAEGCWHSMEMTLAFKPFFGADCELRQIVMRYALLPLLANAIRYSGDEAFANRLSGTVGDDVASRGKTDPLHWLVVCLPWGIVLVWKKVFHRPLPQQAVFTRRFRILKYLFPYGFIVYWTKRTFGGVYE